MLDMVIKGVGINLNMSLKSEGVIDCLSTLFTFPYLPLQFYTFSCP